jgi:hypothetical protein
MKLLLLLSSLAIALAACSRSEKQPSGAQPAVAPPAVPGSSAQETAPSAGAQPPAEGGVTYLPSIDRVLTRGDMEPAETSWVSLGMSFPTLLPDIHYGLLLSETPLLNAAQAPVASPLPAGAHVEVLEIGDWRKAPDGFRNTYRVRSRSDTGSIEGWVDSAAVVLITAEAEGISAGVLLRKIAIGRGDSEFALLAIVADSRVILVDTSVFVFPAAFHPSGVREISITDANADGLPELVMEAETIVSLQYLGASPLRWVAWLRPRSGTWAPILLYNERFGTDEGYSYTASSRAFDSSGRGTLDTVKVTTDYLLVSGQGEFRTAITSFFEWNGSEYRTAAAENLPRQGTVTAGQTPVLRDPGAESGTVDTLHAGDTLYVFDRSDTRQSREESSSWWYRVVTKSGTEGWIDGRSVALSWIDPLKINREAFLGQPPARLTP